MNYKNGHNGAGKEEKKNGNGFFEEVPIQNLGTIYGVKSRFYPALEFLSSKDACLISPRELSYARRINKEERYNSLLNYGCLTNISVISIPNFGNVLTRDIFERNHDMAKEATAAHAREPSENFFIDENLAEEYKEKAKSGAEGTLFLENLIALPTKEFGSDKRGLFIFEDEAQEAGKFLESNKIYEISFQFDSLDHINAHNRPYADQVLISQVARLFNIRGNYKCLGSKDCLVRGLKRAV